MKTLKILIVDDDANMVGTLSDILKLNGYASTGATSAEMALTLLGNQDFDCMITDVRMPGINGVDLFREVKKINPDMPVLLMTAYAQTRLLSEALSEGILAILDKPLNLKKLIDSLKVLSMKNVVLIDDNESFCKVTSDILKQKGFNVTCISDPHNVNIAGDLSKYLVIIDLQLNSITGLDIFDQLKSTCEDLSAVLITGHRQKYVKALSASKTASVLAVLNKPFTPEDLLQEFDRLRLNKFKNALTGA